MISKKRLLLIVHYISIKYNDPYQVSNNSVLNHINYITKMKFLLHTLLKNLLLQYI